MPEFTGERVIPGQVDPDLWNEHRSRYLFASRLCRYKRILDIGCGAGYGTADLATAAQTTVGVDIAADAIGYAQENYQRHNLFYLQASGTSLPFRDASFDLVVAFEMIEHLGDWPALLEEARRVLAHGGQFVVSTPNKEFYAESRRESGVNPYHVHEFSYDTFRTALTERFPHVSLFVQNHGGGIIFQPLDPPTGAELRVDAETPNPTDANFILAVCATTPQTGAPTFVHIPTVANVLRERTQHIRLLEEELREKNGWLQTAKAEHQELLERFRSQKQQLEERNEWARNLDGELSKARERIDQFHMAKDAEISMLAAGYEEKIAALEREAESQSRWAMKTQQELTKCTDLLHEAEKTLAERTAWAQSLDVEVQRLRARDAMVEGSRWVRLGRAFGVGPGAQNR